MNMAKTSVICDWCNKHFLKENNEISRSKKRNVGNYCSRSCVSKYRNSIMSPDFWKRQYKKYPNLKGYANNRKDEFSPFKSFINQGRNSIKKHGCNIDVKYLKEIWESQKGICSYTNIKMILPESTTKYDKIKSLKKASLDRIDSSKGYIEGNVEFVCSAINLAKNNFPKKDMILFVKEIVDVSVKK